MKTCALARLIEIANTQYQAEARAFEKTLRRLGKVEVDLMDSVVLIYVSLSKALPIDALLNTFEKRGYTNEREGQKFFAFMTSKALKTQCAISWSGDPKKVQKFSITFDKLKAPGSDKFKEVDLDDILIIQDNRGLDRKWINDLARGFKAGEKAEPILVVVLTPKVRKEIVEIRNFHEKENTQYKGFMPKGIETSPKKVVLLDGNHRYLAALKAGLKSLPYVETKEPSDIVQIRYDGFV